MSEPALKKQKTKAESQSTTTAYSHDHDHDHSPTAASTNTNKGTIDARTNAPKTHKAAAQMKDEMLNLELIKQGAEGRVYSCTFLGRPCIMKERFRKLYRHPTLDSKLSTARLTQEVRCMAKAKKQTAREKVKQKESVYTPTVYYVDEDQQRIYMEKIEGITVKERLATLNLDQPEDEKIGLELAVKIGRGISDIHAAGILHGDLTTSNLMLVPTADDPIGKLVAIDFGLASVSEKNEERAVDLYVLERAFLSTHPNSEKMFAAILNTYRDTFGHASKVLAWLIKVRSRGRKREMVG